MKNNQTAVKSAIVALNLGLALLTQTSHAQGAKKFKSMREIAGSDFYRLTCSNFNGKQGTILFATIMNQKIAELKFITVDVRDSHNEVDFSSNELAKADPIQISTSALELKASHDVGGLYNEQLSLTIKPSPAGFDARVNYQTEELETIDRDLACGITNYLK